MSTDFVLELGTDFQRVIAYTDSTGTPINLTGYTAHMEARPTVANSSKVLDLTPTIDATAGTIAITVPHTQAINLNLINTEEKTVYETYADGSVKTGYGKTCVYDLMLTSPGSVVTKLLSGTIVFIPNVTR